MRRAQRLVVVKLGGSYAFSPHLKHWLAALATCAGRVVIVPGGGPFADAVRHAQPRMGFDDHTAHHMALLAMWQYGCAIAGLGEGYAVAASLAAIRRAARAGQVPVWSPVATLARSSELPHSWEATADSIAAWLAHRIGARRLLLIKQVAPTTQPVSLDDLVAGGVVDPVLPRILCRAQTEAAIIGAGEHEAAAAALRNGMLPGVRIAFGLGAVRRQTGGARRSKRFQAVDPMLPGPWGRRPTETARGDEDG
jgi:5-(aminomethyl)-3-furanmethanol phosphate kinase